MEIGVQVSSLKPLLKTPEEVSAAFARLAQMGCKTVQLQWIDPCVPIPAIARALKENGLSSVSVQDFYALVQADLSYYTELNRQTGGHWVCVSRIPEHCKSPDGLDVFVQELRQLQQSLNPLGQKLCFHPVSADYAAIPGMDAVGCLLDRMPELDLCLDLCHLGKSCTDMPGFIRRYGSRICMVHFKDSQGSKLVPAGQGEINWNGVVSACLDAGVPYGFVEQEAWDSDPYLCLKEAADWVCSQLL